MQKAIQQNAKKRAHHLQGYRMEVLRKISAVKGTPDFCAKLAQSAGTNCALRPDWAECFSRGGFSTKLGVETGKMISATRRNRFYAKRRPERMKRHPVWTKMGSSMCVCVLRRAGTIYDRFRSSFRRSRLPAAAFGSYSSNRARWLPKCSTRGQQILRGSDTTRAC